MLFNSLEFLIFFPLVVAIYFVIPKKARYTYNFELEKGDKQL